MFQRVSFGVCFQISLHTRSVQLTSVDFIIVLFMEKCHTKQASVNVIPSLLVRTESTKELHLDPLLKQEIFLFSTAFKQILRPTHPPIQWVPGVTRLGREASHSPSVLKSVARTRLVQTGNPSACATANLKCANQR
jgi:hypothetical protein